MYIESFAGLSKAEASERLRYEGQNLSPSRGQRSLLRICIQIVTEPMFTLLLCAVAVYWAIGEVSEALVLLGFITLIMSTTVLQEQRTDRLLDRLKDFLAPEVIVIRDGRTERIESKALVRGDIALIGEGQRVPADGIVTSTLGLRVDESLLTGESFPIERRVSEPLHAGTIISDGSGLMEVTATGPRTTFGQLGLTVKEIVPPQSSLRRSVTKLTQWLFLFATTVSLALGILLGLLWEDWPRAALAGLTLAMGILPQEFPTLLILFLSLAARRLVGHHLLMRKLDSIETIGKITTLCLDKTGTLTENRMTLVQVQLPCGETFHLTSASTHSEEVTSLPEPVSELLRTASLSCDPRSHDPMETELLQVGSHFNPEQSISAQRLERVHQYPFRSSRPWVTQLWRGEQGSPLEVTTKGAPEAILNLCNIDGPERATYLAMAEAMAQSGLRILAVAKGTHSLNEPYPEEPSQFAQRWLGLLGFEDPLKPSARRSVELCKSAGVRVLMITGDHPATAKAIAEQAGIVGGGVVSGSEFERADSAHRALLVQSNAVFARVSPLHKLQIVKALQSCGEVVAMTGDGVNDAPALKASDVGIAMGRRGTDSAREAASIILLDDNFSSVVEAIRSGRSTFENLQKAMVYTLGVHVPIVMLAFLPVLFGTPLLLTPVHIAFLELVINPSSSLVFEAEKPEDDVMKRRPFNGLIFGRQMLQTSLAQGAFIGLMIIFAYHIILGEEEGVGLAGASIFAMLVTASVALVLANRRAALKWHECLQGLPMITLVVLGVTLTAVFIAVTVPVASEAFRFQPIPPLLALAAMGVGLALLLPLHVLKRGVSKKSLS